MPPDPKIQGDVIVLPDGGSAPNTPENRKTLGLDKGPSDLDYVKAQAGRDATAARDSAAQTVGGAATKHEDFETVKDAATMVPAGVANDWDDEIMGHLGAIGEALGNPMQDPKAAAQRGYRMARDAQRGRKAIAMKRSTAAGTVGYGLGTVGQQMVAGPLLRGGTGVLSKAAQYATGTAQAAEGAGIGARIATGAGNAAIPGAIIGAGQADSMEDVPGNAAVGAVIGTGASALMHAPGAIRKGMAHPAVAKAARKAEIDAAMRAAGANRTVGKQIEKNFPGGQEAFVEQQRSIGIGTGRIPSPSRALDESRDAAARIGAERKALEEQARELMIPSDEVADAVNAHAKGLPWPANDALISAYQGEAAKLRKMGRPMAPPDAPPPAMPPPPFPKQDPRLPIDAVVEEIGPGPSPALPPGEPSTGITPYQYRHRTHELPSGDQAPVQAQAQFLNPAPPQAPAPPPRNEVSFPDLNENLRGYQKRAYLAQAEKQGREAELSRQTGHIINDILEQHANKLPEEVGTPWRQKKRLENVAIRSEDMAMAGQSGSNLSKGMKLFGAVTGAGASVFNPLMAIPTVAGLAVTHPGVQMRMAQGIGAISRAAAKPPGTLERVLSKIIPSGSNAGRYLAHGQAQESITAVQEAALRGDEAAHTEHYRRMLTDPSYNRFAMEPDE